MGFPVWPLLIPDPGGTGTSRGSMLQRWGQRRPLLHFCHLLSSEDLPRGWLGLLRVLTRGDLGGFPSVVYSHARGGTCQRWAQQFLLPIFRFLSPQPLYTLLVDGQSCTDINQQVHYSLETWLSTIMIRLSHLIRCHLSSKLKKSRSEV